MVEPIQQVAHRLRELVQVIGDKPEVPAELVQKLRGVSERLTGYVIDLGHQKRNLDRAWAELKRQ